MEFKNIKVLKKTKGVFFNRAEFKGILKKRPTRTGDEIIDKIPSFEMLETLQFCIWWDVSNIFFSKNFYKELLNFGGYEIPSGPFIFYYDNYLKLNDYHNNFKGGKFSYYRYVSIFYYFLVDIRLPGMEGVSADEIRSWIDNLNTFDLGALDRYLRFLSHNDEQRILRESIKTWSILDIKLFFFGYTNLYFAKALLNLRCAQVFGLYTFQKSYDNLEALTFQSSLRYHMTYDLQDNGPVGAAEFAEHQGDIPVSDDFFTSHIYEKVVGWHMHIRHRVRFSWADCFDLLNYRRHRRFDYFIKVCFDERDEFFLRYREIFLDFTKAYYSTFLYDGLNSIRIAGLILSEGVEDLWDIYDWKSLDNFELYLHLVDEVEDIESSLTYTEWNEELEVFGNLTIGPTSEVAEHYYGEKEMYEALSIADWLRVRMSKPKHKFFFNEKVINEAVEGMVEDEASVFIKIPFIGFITTVESLVGGYKGIKGSFRSIKSIAFKNFGGLFNEYLVEVDKCLRLLEFFGEWEFLFYEDYEDFFVIACTFSKQELKEEFSLIQEHCKKKREDEYTNLNFLNLNFYSIQSFLPGYLDNFFGPSSLLRRPYIDYEDLDAVRLIESRSNMVQSFGEFIHDYFLEFLIKYYPNVDGVDKTDYELGKIVYIYYDLFYIPDEEDLIWRLDTVQSKVDINYNLIDFLIILSDIPEVIGFFYYDTIMAFGDEICLDLIIADEPHRDISEMGHPDNVETSGSFGREIDNYEEGANNWGGYADLFTWEDVTLEFWDTDYESKFEENWFMFDTITEQERERFLEGEDFYSIDGYEHFVTTKNVEGFREWGEEWDEGIEPGDLLTIYDEIFPRDKMETSGEFYWWNAVYLQKELFLNEIGYKLDYKYGILLFRPDKKINSLSVSFNIKRFICMSFLMSIFAFIILYCFYEFMYDTGGYIRNIKYFLIEHKNSIAPLHIISTFFLLLFFSFLVWFKLIRNKFVGLFSFINAMLFIAADKFNVVYTEGGHLTPYSDPTAWVSWDTWGFIAPKIFAPMPKGAAGEQNGSKLGNLEELAAQNGIRLSLGYLSIQPGIFIMPEFEKYYSRLPKRFNNFDQKVIFGLIRTQHIMSQFEGGMQLSGGTDGGKGGLFKLSPLVWFFEWNWRYRVGKAELYWQIGNGWWFEESSWWISGSKSVRTASYIVGRSRGRARYKFGCPYQVTDSLEYNGNYRNETGTHGSFIRMSDNIARAFYWGYSTRYHKYDAHDKITLKGKYVYYREPGDPVTSVRWRYVRYSGVRRVAYRRIWKDKVRGKFLFQSVEDEYGDLNRILPSSRIYKYKRPHKRALKGLLQIYLKNNLRYEISRGLREQPFPETLEDVQKSIIRVLYDYILVEYLKPIQGWVFWIIQPGSIADDMIRFYWYLYDILKKKEVEKYIVDGFNFIPDIRNEGDFFMDGISSRIRNNFARPFNWDRGDFKKNNQEMYEYGALLPRVFKREFEAFNAKHVEYDFSKYRKGRRGRNINDFCWGHLRFMFWDVMYPLHEWAEWITYTVDYYGSQGGPAITGWDDTEITVPDGNYQKLPLGHLGHEGKNSFFRALFFKFPRIICDLQTDLNKIEPDISYKVKGTKGYQCVILYVGHMRFLFGYTDFNSLDIDHFFINRPNMVATHESVWTRWGVRYRAKHDTMHHAKVHGRHGIYYFNVI